MGFGFSSKRIVLVIVRHPMFPGNTWDASPDPASYVKCWPFTRAGDSQASWVHLKPCTARKRSIMTKGGRGGGSRVPESLHLEWQKTWLCLGITDSSQEKQLIEEGCNSQRDWGFKHLELGTGPGSGSPGVRPCWVYFGSLFGIYSTASLGGYFKMLCQSTRPPSSFCFCAHTDEELS